MNDKASRRARRKLKQGTVGRVADRPSGPVVVLLNIDQDIDDGCPECLCVRSLSARAGPDGLIPLDVHEFAVLQRFVGH